MVKKKRMSLSEIQKEDKQEVFSPQETEAVFVAPIKKKKVQVNVDENVAKLSVVIPLNTFEILQDISRKRRRDKQPFKISDMVREALGTWLSKQETN